ncbi:MAG: flavodoxin, partial [Chloroflexi bacterium]|nr:flavodoxin [Chloroflexota bacterium]
LDRFRADLQSIPTAVFALGPTTEPRSEKEWTDARAILDKELASRSWYGPTAVALFGGRWDPTKIGFPFKAFAKSMPTTDLRDWDAIRAWAEALFLD